jgi:hypothetical protein
VVLLLAVALVVVLPPVVLPEFPLVVDLATTVTMVTTEADLPAPSLLEALRVVVSVLLAPSPPVLRLLVLPKLAVRLTAPSGVSAALVVATRALVATVMTPLLLLVLPPVFPLAAPAVALVVASAASRALPAPPSQLLPDPLLQAPRARVKARVKVRASVRARVRASSVSTLARSAPPRSKVLRQFLHSFEAFSLPLVR